MSALPDTSQAEGGAAEAQGRAPGAMQALAGAAGPAPYDADEFLCAICFELLHCPVVSYCGHAFCFWCFRRYPPPPPPLLAMSQTGGGGGVPRL